MRILIIEFNVILHERFFNYDLDKNGEEITVDESGNELPILADNEVIDDGTYGEVGQEFVEGQWVFVEHSKIVCRFVRIVDNVIVSERFSTLIAEGEIECDGTYGVVGSELIEGQWVYTEPESVPSETEQAQATQTMTLINLMEDMQTTQAEINALKGV